MTRSDILGARDEHTVTKSGTRTSPTIDPVTARSIADFLPKV